jgi:hypothetical protein
MTTYLVASGRLMSALSAQVRDRVDCVAAEELSDDRWSKVMDALAKGASLIAVGIEILPRLRRLWVDSYAFQASALEPAETELLPLPGVAWQGGPCRGLCIRPDRFKVYFGHDEMPRMELIPLLVAADQQGCPRAFPAVCFKHFAGSLMANRFAGSHWFVFAFEDPLKTLDAPGWTRVVERLLDSTDGGLMIVDAKAHYSCYHAGERVLVNVRVANRGDDVQAVRLDFAAYTPDGAKSTARWIRRCLNRNEEIVVPWEFFAGAAPGLWHVRVELYHEDRFVYGRDRAEHARLIQRSECAYVLASEDVSGYPRPALEGRSLRVGRKDGFLAGTHYYPSSSWFDWAWRDFRPEKAAQDIAEMARCGYSLVRVWVDPELDEQALRGFEAWLHLSARAGIVSIVCVFSQWPRHLSYPDGLGMTTFEFMGPADYNVYSVQLLNIEHQQRYLAALVERWRHLPNLIWNLSNETQVVDPDPDQMDAKCFGDVEPKHGPLAGAAYFNRWADIMTQTLRKAGAQQPVLRGYGFIMAGDCYLQNRAGDLLTWHHYAPGDVLGPCLAFAHPGLIEKPLLQEEFGIPSEDERERLERYEGVACWAAVMGAAGACSYEWGVSWLAREMNYVASPLKDACLLPAPDPRWAKGQLDYSASWPVGSVGICPWAASFCYGSNYPCTPFPTPAAVALGDVGRFCADIGPPSGAEKVLLVVPMEWADFAPHRGYMRQLDPTYKSVQALAAAHIPFSVIQEDQLSELRDLPEAVVFPASAAISPATQARLDALAGRGVAVHCGPAAGCVGRLGNYAIQLESPKAVWCLRRRTRRGALYFLLAREGPTDVTLLAWEARVSLSLTRHALVEVREDRAVRTFIGRAQPPPKTNHR